MNLRQKLVDYILRYLFFSPSQGSWHLSGNLILAVLISLVFQFLIFIINVCCAAIWNIAFQVLRLLCFRKMFTTRLEDVFRWGLFIWTHYLEWCVWLWASPKMKPANFFIIHSFQVSQLHLSFSLTLSLSLSLSLFLSHSLSLKQTRRHSRSPLEKLIWTCIGVRACVWRAGLATTISSLIHFTHSSLFHSRVCPTHSHQCVVSCTCLQAAAAAATLGTRGHLGAAAVTVAHRLALSRLIFFLLMQKVDFDRVGRTVGAKNDEDAAASTPWNISNAAIKKLSVGTIPAFMKFVSQLSLVVFFFLSCCGHASKTN